MIKSFCFFINELLMGEKKILYIRLNSSPLPEACDEIIVKDFNLESYFCALLGRRLLEDAGLGGVLPYPGSLIADFEKFDKERYGEIALQWKQILINLLNIVHIQNGTYEINLPLSYVDWLRNNYNDVYKRLTLEYKKLVILFSKEFVYNEIIKDVLVRKLHFFLAKNVCEIQRIIFSVDVFIQNSIFMKEISKCVGYQIWETFKIGFSPYKVCYPYSEGLAAVCKKTKWGYIDKEGNEIIPQVYDMVGSFSEGLAAICKKGKWGYIDKGGNEIIQCIYDGADSFSQGLAMVIINGEYNVIDKCGNKIIPNTHTLVYLLSHHAISEGFIAVKDIKNLKCGFINAKGKEVIPCIYTHVNRFSEGLAMVRIEAKSERTKEIEKKLDSWCVCDSIKAEFISMCYEGPCGFIDRNGNEVIPCIYDDASDFSEGLAVIVKNGKYGFIDKNGNEVIPCIYDDASDFSQGMARVKKRDKYGFIDRYGNQIIPCIYERESIATILEVEGDFIWNKKNGKFGFINKNGKEVVPCIYDYASGFCKKYAYFVKRTNLKENIGLVNEKGEEFVFINTPVFCSEGMISIKECENDSKDYRYNFIPVQWLKDL